MTDRSRFGPKQKHHEQLQSTSENKSGTYCGPIPKLLGESLAGHTVAASTHVRRADPSRGSLPRVSFLPFFLPPEFIMLRNALRCTAFVIFCALTNAGLTAAEPNVAPTA